MHLTLHYFTALFSSMQVTNASIDLGPGAQIAGLACSVDSIAYSRHEDRYKFRFIHVKRSMDSEPLQLVFG